VELSSVKANNFLVHQEADYAVYLLISQYFTSALVLQKNVTEIPRFAAEQDCQEM
jgi:hypothetical protein